jgi:hypothetical protein
MSTLRCDTDVRRESVRSREGLNGLDFVEVDSAQTTLTAYFLGRAPAGLNKRNFSIVGGRTPKDAVEVIGLDVQPSEYSYLDDRVLIHLNHPGDFSTYTLQLQGVEGIDPRYASVEFSFKTHCPSDLDCAAPCACEPAVYEKPAIDYEAKDYASFRQLILDRMALICPDWRERLVPDLGIALVEALAYVGDYLSYYQDAVATEAYLDTARRRPSVRRHVRLVDYSLGEGCNARAFVALKTQADLHVKAADILFTTGLNHLLPIGERKALRGYEIERVPQERFEVFAPLWPSGEIHWRPANNEIHFYTWGGRECCLRKGATAATLRNDGEIPVTLQSGDFLIFEEVLGPATGSPDDADPAHRQAVRLTKVSEGYDALYGVRLLEIEWHEEDALRFDLCISTIGAAPECRYLEDVSLAWGNVLLVDHGRPVSEPLGPVPEAPEIPCCECEGRPSETLKLNGRFRPKLSGRPLTFVDPTDPSFSAARLLAPDPLAAQAAIRLEASGGEVFTARADLIESSRDDLHFVVEMEEDGTANLRFGDGELGRRPRAGETFLAHYRAGNGPAGNVGADAISMLIHRESDFSNDIEWVSNRLPASGGTPPTPLAEAKLAAPEAFRHGKAALRRAIIASDYAALAERHRKVQRAAARLTWTGSWYEADVGVDPLKAFAHASPALVAEIRQYLEGFRRIGHELTVGVARFVPIDLALTVCIAPEYLRGQVKAALLDAFGNRSLRGGTMGFFHSDQLSFGDDIHLSAIVARAQSVPGVLSVRIDRFRRQFAPPNREIENGVLPLGPFEIAQLENDPNHPDRGQLELRVLGGR